MVRNLQAATLVIVWLRLTLLSQTANPGQIYCVAKSVGFYGRSAITFFFRVCYNKSG